MVLRRLVVASGFSAVVWWPAACRTRTAHAAGRRGEGRGGRLQIGRSQEASRRRRVWTGGEAASWLVLPSEKAGGDWGSGDTGPENGRRCTRAYALAPS